MKTVIFLMCGCFCLLVQSEDTDRYTYCESCLYIAQEIEKALTDVPAESRQAVFEKLIHGSVCEKLLPAKHQHLSKERLTSSCMHLLESHYDQFRAALVTGNSKQLDIVLCYEQSTACTGVKRQSFQDSKRTFTGSDIDALLRDNKEHVRMAKPIHSGSPVHSKDEL